MDKNKRLKKQLAADEQVLKTHPLTSSRFILLQKTLQHVQLQMDWILDGPANRLLMIFDLAFIGATSAQGQTGFIGPAFMQLENKISQILQEIVKKSEQELVPLITRWIRLIAIGTVYLSTQLLENWKRAFPPHDPQITEKAGFLLRELGMTFVLGSKVIESAFRYFVEALGLKKSTQTSVIDVGTSYLFLLILLMEQEKKQNNEDFCQIVKTHLDPRLERLEAIFKEMPGENGENNQTLLQLHQMRQMIHQDHIEEVYEINNQDIIKDLQRIQLFCRQLNANFSHLFYQTQMAATTIVHTF